MVRPGSLKTLEDVAAWIYEHEGRIEAWWEAQREHNARVTTTASDCQKTMGDKIDTINAKIDRLNRTIYMAIGAATLGGSLVGIGVTVAVAFINGG